MAKVLQLALPTVPPSQVEGGRGAGTVAGRHAGRHAGSSHSLITVAQAGRPGKERGREGARQESKGKYVGAGQAFAGISLPPPRITPTQITRPLALSLSLAPFGDGSLAGGAERETDKTVPPAQVCVLSGVMCECVWAGGGVPCLSLGEVSVGGRYSTTGPPSPLLP